MAPRLGLVLCTTYSEAARGGAEEGWDDPNGGQGREQDHLSNCRSRPPCWSGGTDGDWVDISRSRCRGHRLLLPVARRDPEPTSSSASPPRATPHPEFGLPYSNISPKSPPKEPQINNNPVEQQLLKKYLFPRRPKKKREKKKPNEAESPALPPRKTPSATVIYSTSLFPEHAFFPIALERRDTSLRAGTFQKTSPTSSGIL